MQIPKIISIIISLIISLILIYFGYYIYILIIFQNGNQNIINVTNINKQLKNNKEQKNYAILPHFMIQPSKVDEFYQFLKSNYYGESIHNLKIVLISPNHFFLGEKQFESISDKVQLCYQQNCLRVSPFLKSNLIGTGRKNTDAYRSNDLIQYYGNYRITKEHGIGEHFKFLNKYFPNNEVYILLVNSNKFQNMTGIIEILQGITGNVLYLASVDFSHYVSEDFAYLHDRKTLYTLINNQNIDEFKLIEADCPVCLYLINKLSFLNGKSPQLRYRDSSSVIMKKNLLNENTSRMFINYNVSGNLQNGLTVAFFGDLIYDRGVAYKLDSTQKILNYFFDFFSQGNTGINLLGSTHRKLFGIDFVGLNLETPVVDDKKLCIKSSKEVQFCSLVTILKPLRDLGFNIVNIANNHSMDGGISAHQKTLENLYNNNIKYFGYIRHGKYLENNYIYTGIIRNIKFAWHGYDFTITKNLINKYCNILTEYQQKGYLNLVSVHWGNEFEIQHKANQQIYAEKLIDCGAEIIIGHHPHVIQDIGWYKDKPIIYSLGNFLFDQKKVPMTYTGGYLLIDIPITGKIEIFTGKRNAYVN